MAIENYADLTAEEMKALAFFFGRPNVALQFSEFKDWMGEEINFSDVFKTLVNEGLMYPFPQNIVGGPISLKPKGTKLSSETPQALFDRYLKELEIKKSLGGYVSETEKMEKLKNG